MRFRASMLTACLLAVCLLACFSAVTCLGSVRIVAAPIAERSPGEAPRADPMPTTVELDLCVDGSASYPCPTPVTMDSTFIPAISLTYGQILDGVVNYSGGAVGPITIYANGQLICTLQAETPDACPAASTIFDVGTYILTADFNPTNGYEPSASKPVTVTVTQDSITGITVATSLTPAPEGTAVTFTANVAGANDAVPTGAVSFSDGNLQLKTVALDGNGNAAFTTSTLTVGMHQISAVYPGAQDFLAAPAPAAVEQTITPVVVSLGTETTLASSVNPSVVGENVTFTAEVGTTGPFIGSPGAAVTFRDGTTPFATVVATAGIAKTSISTLSAGTHNVTAAYSGDASTAPSTSKVLVQQVEYPLAMFPPGYTITVTPSPVTIGVGLTARLAVTVTPVGGFSAPVTLACTHLPNEGACTFAQTVIPAGGGTTTLDLSTMAPHDCGSSVPYYLGGASLPRGVRRMVPCSGAALALVFVLMLPRRRRWLRSLVAILAVCGIAGLTGCSRCTDFGTVPGSYTFNVTGTAPRQAVPVTAGTPPGDPAVALDVTTSVGLSVLY